MLDVVREFFDRTLEHPGPDLASAAASRQSNEYIPISSRLWPKPSQASLYVGSQQRTVRVLGTHRRSQPDMGYGLKRRRLKGAPGTKTWVGWGALPTTSTPTRSTPFEAPDSIPPRPGTPTHRTAASQRPRRPAPGAAVSSLTTRGAVKFGKERIQSAASVRSRNFQVAFHTRSACPRCADERAFSPRTEASHRAHEPRECSRHLRSVTVRGPDGRSAHAVPMQSAGEEGLGARMLLVRSDGEHRSRVPHRSEPTTVCGCRRGATIRRCSSHRVSEKTRSRGRRGR
jgi:hypothetical protein